MDHANAHIIEYATDSENIQTIESHFSHADEHESLNKSESLVHNKQQHQEASYYKAIGNIILNYQEVLLFGPTDAKVELYNILKEDHHFDKIHIDIKHADKMTENQQHAFVKSFFLNQ